MNLFDKYHLNTYDKQDTYELYEWLITDHVSSESPTCDYSFLLGAFASLSGLNILDFFSDSGCFYQELFLVAVDYRFSSHFSIMTFDEAVRSTLSVSCSTPQYDLPRFLNKYVDFCNDFDEEVI